METLQTVIRMMTSGCFMSSCDIRDAYYSVKVAAFFQKFIMFMWKGKYYMFTCFPNGLASCPRVREIVETVFSDYKETRVSSRVIYR